MEENENLEEVVETNAEVAETSDENAQKIEQLQKALNAERSMRKEAEQKLKSDQKEEEEEIKEVEEKIRKSLLEGDLTSDVADTLMNSFGKDIARNQVKGAKKEIEREIMELRRDPTYRDIEEYGSEIRKLMKSGLSAESAYWAVAGKNKFSNFESTKEDKQKKDEQEKINKERASEGYVDATPGAEDKKPRYTQMENYIAEETGKSQEEIRARSGAKSIDELIALKEKYKKGGK